MTIPTIAMTANAFVRDVQDAPDTGMNAHIAKPISIETLKNTLASCLKLRRKPLPQMQEGLFHRKRDRRNFR